MVSSAVRRKRIPSVLERLRLAVLLSGLTITILLLLALIGLTAATLDDTASLTPEVPVPNRVSFYYHAAAGTILNRIGASPEGAAIQWVKAAAHARSQNQVVQAAQGIAAARARDREVSYAYFDTTLCTMIRHGSNGTIGAVQQSGIHCSVAVLYPYQVPEGVIINYDSHPPIGGPHYDRGYPRYGVVETPILPGYWVHNLEYGAIVLLYNCTDGCPELIAQIQALYPQLPLGRNAAPGAPRLLALPYQSMDHRLAVVAWDHLLELDTFDRDQIIAFYERFLDHGPECNGIKCPQ